MTVDISQLGIISLTDAQPRNQLEDYVRQIEDMGYGSIWLPELTGREPFSTASWLLARTKRLHVATGIANVYARDAMAAAQSSQTLAELSEGRFAMGFGVSHPHFATARGHEWVAPARKMRAYLEALRSTEVHSVKPPAPAPVYVAAHGPLLLRAAAELADGALGYLMPPQHGERAKTTLGNKPLLSVLPFCMNDDRERALKAAHKGLAMYMELPAYHRAWSHFGLDVAQGDELVDQIGAFGDAAHVRRRIQDYLDAGADRVILSPFHGDTPKPESRTRLEALAELAD